ncbi:MAG: luciferase, partial [Candidatus Thalassarchaeaceae archaeon]
RRDLLNLVLGSHDSVLQEKVNRFRPVQVFNLSITPPNIIEETHERMSSSYHVDGGKWERRMMPRTVMVFVNDEEGLSKEEQDAAAMDEARSALSTYWSALEGTIDPSKIERATDNAVIGSVDSVSEQISERFHPDDRIMCWFDFFNHDSARVMRNMAAFMNKVAPRVNGGI